MIDPTEAWLVRQFKSEHGIDDPSIESKEDLQQYVKNQMEDIKAMAAQMRATKSQQVKQQLTDPDSWLDGKLDKVKPTNLQMFLEEQGSVITTNEFTKICRLKKIPLGLLLNFALYEGILNTDKETIESLADYLKTFFWDRKLRTVEQIQSGTNLNDEKITGGYYSNEAKEQLGDGRINRGMISYYKDAVPYGYNIDSALVEKIKAIYNELIQQLYGE